jgi:hypothetical protein
MKLDFWRSAQKKQKTIPNVTFHHHVPEAVALPIDVSRILLL